MIYQTDVAKAIIEAGANTAVSERRFLELEIARWKKSPVRKTMLDGERYHNGDHDILQRKRKAIGRDGKLQEVDNLPNNRIVDNQYAKMVEQKVNYILGKPLTIETKNKTYLEALKKIFNKKMHRKLKRLAENCIDGGIAWLYPYYAADGTLAFRVFPGYEILPFWKDAEHTELDYAVRLYEVEAYEGETLKIIEKVEVYKPTGIERYILQNGSLIDDVENPSSAYLIIEDEEGNVSGLNWERIPLIPFKYNNKEQPLLKRVKTLQDGINTMLSDFENNMQEDSRNTILVIKNYDGTNLGEFRHNLATYGAVKVKTVDGADGGVDTLEVKVNADNYKAIVEIFKKALIENAMGYDAKDDKLSGNPNQMNILSMYSDIELDANGIETEFQASFEELLWFINTHLANTGVGDFFDEEVTFTFDRTILMNESEAIMNCKNSVGILSDETIIGEHPWVTDVAQELERIRKQRESEMDEYQNLFGKKPNDDPDDGGDDQSPGGDQAE
mgnify:CR=1 FL=1